MARIARSSYLAAVAAAALLVHCQDPTKNALRDAGSLGRARAAFGPNQAVRESSVHVPAAHVFTAVPDPAPADFDGLSALLVPDEGAVLRGGPALRFAWEHGVRDAETLASLASLLLVGSEGPAQESQRGQAFIRHHDEIAPPVLEADRLVFWVVRGAMSPEATKVTVDLTRFERVAPPP